MRVRVWGVESGLQFANNLFTNGNFYMNTSDIKKAVVTTAMVLVTIFALRQVALTRGLVDKALN